MRRTLYSLQRVVERGWTVKSTNSRPRPSGFWRGILYCAQLPADAWIRRRCGVKSEDTSPNGEDHESPREIARRRTEFERIIGHELRSPLNTISLSADVLEAMDDAAVRRRHLSVIRSAVRQASDLLIDLDLLVMMEQGARNSTPMVPLADVMKGVREELALQAETAEVDLSFASPPPRLYVERVVARLALSNLVSNAIKYRDRAKSTHWIRVSAEAARGERVVVEVADNGIGIDSGNHQRVFERHFRASPELAEGSGLGLAIVREVLTDRGGGIDLCSEEFVGTTVRVHLRAESCAAVGEAAEQSAALMS